MHTVAIGNQGLHSFVDVFVSGMYGTLGIKK